MEKFSFPRRTINTGFITKRNAAGDFSDMPSDVVINVDGVTFSLHKFPLQSRSGKIKKLVEELSETDAIANPMLEFSDFPGGPDIFELAAKFCYNINFDITISNAAQLRCAAEFLEMTDEYGEENLHSRTEAFLNEIVLNSIEKSAAVLRACTPILQHAEEAKLVNRCIDAIASKVCSEDTVKEHIISVFSTIGGRNLLKPNPNSDFTNSIHHINPSHNPNYIHLGKLNPNSNPNFTSSMHQNANNHNPNPNLTPSINHLSPTNCTAVIEWWADEICDLRIDLFQRLVAAMKSHGIRNESLGGALIHYAYKTLKSLNKKLPSYDSKSKVKLTIGGIPTLISSKAMEHEQRILLESIVSMLPQEKYIFSTNFLLSLLRSAVLLDTTVACRLDLERRVGAQLEHASVDDLLIPATVSHSGGQVGEESCQYDVDVIQRVVTTYMQQKQEEEGAVGGGQLESSSMCESEGGFGSPEGRHLGTTKVGKLMDLYLAEIAPDPHLKVSKFTALAEVLPDYARVLDDGLYRAIDIFLKAHPTLSDLERRKVCKLLDCQKLSQEACAHAAQNERLPVQLVVQVLYFEQLRMRTAMSAPPAGNDPPLPGALFHESHNRNLPLASPRLDPYSSLRRDNRELKLEVARLRLRVNDLEKENGVLKEELLCRPPVHSTGSGGFFSLISRRFGRMGLFSSSSQKSPSSKQPSDFKPPPRRRRHSIS